MQCKLVKIVLSILVALSLVGCGSKSIANENADIVVEDSMEQVMADNVSGHNGQSEASAVKVQMNEELAEKYNASIISLSDEEVLVDGEFVAGDSSNPVYVANDVVFYLEGQDFTYGEGTKEDEHSQEEADLHTVVHITKPGNYVVSGKLSAGQIAIDLGEDAKEDENAVVNLILNNVDITCSVAPGVIFYNVYECGSDEEEQASKDVDTSNAGANVIIADGSVNTVNGSYVARIYKSVELNEEGTEVIDSKKLHKYDGAFYSKMSMNMNGEENNSGILNINAENEGLDSELHLTMNGGIININSGNDGINTNEDGISVTTINGGNLNIVVNGSTGEGDGIDSNGWLVINGGVVTASACGVSMDAGIDSDKGIYIDGGIVAASGNMLDRIEENSQNYAVFSFDSVVDGGTNIVLKNEDGNVVCQYVPVNNCSYLIVSSSELVEGIYTLWNEETQLAGAKMENTMRGEFGTASGERMPEGENPQLSEGEFPQMPEDEKPQLSEGEFPQMSKGEKPQFNEGEFPQMPEGEKTQKPMGGRGGFSGMQDMENSTEFEITHGGNMFMVSSNVKTQ